MDTNSREYVMAIRSDSIGGDAKDSGCSGANFTQHVLRTSSALYSRSFASFRGSNSPSLAQRRRVTENESNQLTLEVLVRRIATAEHIGHQVHDLVSGQQTQ